MNVLLVEPDLSRGKRLCEALAARGHFLRHSVDPFYALTLAERAVIDVVFVSARISAIGVGEFVQILHEDPALAAIRVAVYDAEDAPAGLNLPAATATLPARTDAELIGAVASRLTRPAAVADTPSPLQNRAPASEPASRAPAPEVVSAPASRTAIAMIGVFEMTTLPVLLQMVCSSTDHGKVQVKTPHGIGRISYSPGLVLRIDYRDLEGVDAMAQLLLDVEETPSSQFRVAKTAADQEQSIGVRPDELLLEVAVLCDDIKRGKRRAGGSA